jgi:hypothetical protein
LTIEEKKRFNLNKVKYNKKLTKKQYAEYNADRRKRKGDALKEFFKANKKEYYQANKEKINAKNRQYYQKNKAKMQADSRARRRNQKRKESTQSSEKVLQ